MPYSKIEGKTFENLETELKEVYSKYAEYHDVGFHNMVVLFSNDDFYHCHYVAKQFLYLKRKMHKEIKKQLGIEISNCETCMWLGTEDDGNYPEHAISWRVCHEFEQYQYLKSFPFEKEMDCWEPEFWHSKFAADMKEGTHDELMELIDKFVIARDFLPPKYIHMWT